MDLNVKISLQIPQSEREDRYFSFRLKQHLSNEPSVYKQPERLFVVSNIKGNLRGFYKLLFRNRVIDRYFQWSFGDGHLVILGNSLDENEQFLECLWFIYSLEEKARLGGGYVHFLLGNNEIANMNRDWWNMHPKYARKRSLTVSGHNSTTALYDASNELWRWLCTKNIMEKVGGVLFVYGGIAPELNRLSLSVADTNILARSYYTLSNPPIDIQDHAVLFDNNVSPLGYAGYYNGNASQEQIDETLMKMGVKAIITGYALSGQVTALFDGRVINVNTDYITPKPEGLLIKKDRFYRISRYGKKERVK